jgi:hypothetical protein
MNAKINLISSLEVTSGKAYDEHHFCSLVEQDLKLKLPINTYVADRGYDESHNRFFLEHHPPHSAICLKALRTQKKDPNKKVRQNHFKVRL